MRKVFALCLICSLPFLVGGCGNGQGGNDVGAQEQVGELPRYKVELAQFTAGSPVRVRVRPDDITPYPK